MILKGASSTLSVITGSATTVDVHASFVDYVDAASTVTPGTRNVAITTATTTVVVLAPGASTSREVKVLTITNKGGSANTVTLSHTDGTTAAQYGAPVPLPAGWSVVVPQSGAWDIYNASGVKVSSITNAPTVNALNTVVLAADVTNNNAVANTMQDVTALSFAVVAGQTYWFRAAITFTAAATTTGSRWSINGPGSPTRLDFASRYSLTTTSETVNQGLSAYDTPAAANASSAATGANQAIVEGFITPSADGTVIVRHASEITASAIVAKAGSILQWMRVL